MAYSSSATANVRNCRTSTSGALSIMASSESGELAVVGRGAAPCQRRRQWTRGGARTRWLRLARAGAGAAAVVRIVHGEERHEVLQGLGLRGQLLRGRGQLLGGGGVALRQLVDAAHGLVH